MSYKLFRLFFALTLVTGLIVAPTPQSARAAGSLYVTPTGDDNNNCVNPGTPCATINGALNNPSFVAGDTILVAIGIYTGTGTEVVLLDKNATLSGGWDDTFTTQSGMSTIDGQGARRGTIVNSGVLSTIEHFVVQNGFFDGAFNGGAGIRNDGNLMVNNSLISSNLAINCGEGGNIYNTGALSINNSAIQNGSADCGGGGLENYSGSVTLSNSSVKNNYGVSGLDNNGGTITLINSTVSGTTGSGVGINSYNSGAINLFESIVGSNVGVGILIQSGTLIVNNSSVHNNSGGGIYVGAGAGTINNSTVSSNGEAPSSTGGIYNEGGGTVNLNSSTITSNTGAHYSAAGGITNFGSVTMQNMILAGNMGSVASDCSGTISSSGYNLVGNISGCAFIIAIGDLTYVDPILGLLVGSPAYHALASNSPAIDAGNPAGCMDQDGNLFTTDQRGLTRVGTCDIGAYEYTTPGPASSLSVVGGDNQSTTATFAFPEHLQVVALDNQGSPVSGVTIDFTAPASGPSGTFADLGTNTTSVDTDAGGVATTSTFTANDQAGAYLVVAAAPGLGSVNFNLEQFDVPGNDNFVGADAIPSLPFNTTVDITNATNIGEPGGCYYLMERTVWYSFTPTVTSGVSVSTQGSASNRNVNIYRAAGPDIADLTFLDCAIENDSATFVAEFGKTYYLQVGSVFDQVGTIELNLEPIPSPENDNFINAEPVSLPLPFDHFVDLSAASSQDDEPIPSCASFGLNGTVWYVFTPTQTGAVSARINNATEYTQLAAYSGSSLDDLTELGCNAPFGGVVSLLVEAGTTYYFQAGNFVSNQSGSMQFHLEVTPLPVADFYYYPGDPSKFDTIQFQDNSYDPGLFGIQTYQWNFGDGVNSSGYSATHKYAKDGDYVVTHSVTTIDGRTASVTQTVQIRTHDVAITKITAPNSANVGQTKTITVNLRNIAYPETVQVDLYKSTPSGFVWVATVTKLVPALSGNRTTAFDFSYKFTSDDAKVGKVTFKAVATITSARDAWPSDNEIFSLQTKVVK